MAALNAGFVYAYSPYGEVAVLGPDGGNDLQYAGLKNDGTGLYQAMYRYYDPVLKQWISEDPIGMTGGPNLRQYVGANPVSFSDPEGLQPGPNPHNLPLGQRLGGRMGPPRPPNPAPAPKKEPCPEDCARDCLVGLLPYGLAKAGAISTTAHFVGGLVAAVDVSLTPLGVVAGSVMGLDYCSKKCGLETGTMTPFSITAP